MRVRTITANPQYGDLAPRAGADGTALALTKANAARHGRPHGENGRNTEPLSKIAAFARFVDDTLHGEVDIALFKLCYVDITPSTDVAALARAYRQTMTDLSARYPGVRVVHVTCPITAVTSPWRARVKRVLGRPEPGFAANASRERYSRLLREAYRTALK